VLIGEGILGSSKIRFAILASGNGSNAENILRYTSHRPDKFQATCLISDNASAYALQRATALGVKAVVVSPNSAIVDKKQRKRAHELSIIEILVNQKCDWLFLAGYMRILSGEFLSHFYDQALGCARVINVHPSLLPSFRGKNAYQQAYDFGVKVAGVTIHFVDEGVDSGQIIMQRSFEREEHDTLESFIRKGLAVEHVLYLEALEKIETYRTQITSEDLK